MNQNRRPPYLLLCIGTAVALGLGVLTSTYPVHAHITATCFWIGEDATKDNAGIPNTETEWDPQAGKHFGGVDDPQKRGQNGLPANFKPRQNPYYIALPASEFDDNGPIAAGRQKSPWANEASKLRDNESLFKGRWVKVTDQATDTVVYAQWVDTGPSNNPSAARDYGYVFGSGSQKPQNRFDKRAGIDVSPTIAFRFHMLESGVTTVSWQFVDAKNVPDGPWRDYPAINNRIY